MEMELSFFSQKDMKTTLLFVKYFFCKHFSKVFITVGFLFQWIVNIFQRSFH